MLQTSVANRNLVDRPLEILVLEDNEADFFLVKRYLRVNDIPCQCRRVDRPEPLWEALAQQSWDLILADCALRLGATD